MAVQQRPRQEGTIGHRAAANRPKVECGFESNVWRTFWEGAGLNV